MNQLTVKKVDFYGDETAIVTLESDISTVEVFCHLCEYEEGDKIENFLQVLDSKAKAAYLPDWPDGLIKEKTKERLDKTGSFSYTGCGKVIDTESSIIEVQGFRIELDETPAADIVEFEISRLDLW